MLSDQLERLQTQLERLKDHWAAGTPVKRGLMVGVPVLVLALAGTGIGVAATHAGGSSPAQLRADVADEATQTPASAGLQASSEPPPTGGTTSGRHYTPNGGTGPGAAQSTGMELSIPAIGVDASVYSRSVGTNGQMGNPIGAWDAIWYDFSAWPGMGGYPGEPGANAVFAGHVDYIHIGPAVFWSIRDLSPGDRVTVTTSNGPVTYAIQWSQWAEPDVDFTQFVAKTGQDAITLVTC